jgi:GNAT superfamily N-acetyltransferase
VGAVTVQLDENPSAEELRQLVDEVRNYNWAVTRHERPRPVACFLRDAEGRILGGAHGELWGRSVHIAAMWVAASERGKGYGARLLREVENYAARHGHVLAYLETLSFQARPFYEKLGYQVFGELVGIGEGCTLFFLRRDLLVPEEGHLCGSPGARELVQDCP